MTEAACCEGTKKPLKGKKNNKNLAGNNNRGKYQRVYICMYVCVLLL